MPGARCINSPFSIGEFEITGKPLSSQDGALRMEFPPSFCLLRLFLFDTCVFQSPSASAETGSSLATAPNGIAHLATSASGAQGPACHDMAIPPLPIEEYFTDEDYLPPRSPGLQPVKIDLDPGSPWLQPVKIDLNPRKRGRPSYQLSSDDEDDEDDDELDLVSLLISSHLHRQTSLGNQTDPLRFV